MNLTGSGLWKLLLKYIHMLKWVNNLARGGKDLTAVCYGATAYYYDYDVNVYYSPATTFTELTVQ